MPPRALCPQLWPAESMHLPSGAPGGLAPGRTLGRPPTSPPIHIPGLRIPAPSCCWGLPGALGTCPPGEKGPQPRLAIGCSFSCHAQNSLLYPHHNRGGLENSGVLCRSSPSQGRARSEFWAGQSQVEISLQPDRQGDWVGVQIPPGFSSSSNIGQPVPLKHSPA